MPAHKAVQLTPHALLTSYQVADLLQVNPSSVNKWIRDGRLPAFRTPGGHRRIRVADVTAFLQAHQMPIPGSLRPASAAQVVAVGTNVHLFDTLARELKRLSPTLVLTVLSDSVEALMHIAQARPDMVLLGPNMAPLSAAELCRRLRAHPACARLRLVVMDAEAMAQGADAQLAHPLEAERVLELLAPAARAS
jgi:excisionase family DNA binding protein